MVNYTYELSRVREHRYAGDQVPLTLSTAGQPGPGSYQGDCPDHGVHEPLEHDEQIVIERDGDTWRLPETYNVSYCEACLDYYRREAHLGEDGDPELLEDLRGLIELNWRSVRGAFRPDDPSNIERVPVGEHGDGEEA